MSRCYYNHLQHYFPFYWKPPDPETSGSEEEGCPTNTLQYFSHLLENTRRAGFEFCTRGLGTGA